MTRRTAHREDRESKGADSGDDTLRQAHGRDRIAERSIGISAGAVQVDFPASDAGRATDTRRPDRELGKELYELDAAEILEGLSANDRSDEGDLRTGWEESRAVYFGLLLGAESGAGQAQSGAGESQETHTPDPDRSLDHGISSVGADILSALPRAGLIEDDSEDEEERRKRIEAEQNGSDIGAAIGLAIGLIHNRSQQKKGTVKQTNTRMKRIHKSLFRECKMNDYLTAEKAKISIGGVPNANRRS